MSGETLSPKPFQGKRKPPISSIVIDENYIEKSLTTASDYCRGFK